MSGRIVSSTKSFSLPASEPVVHLATRPVANGNELLVVQRNGDILGLDSETLQQAWKTSSIVLHQDLAFESKSDFHLDHCISASLSEVVQGVFKGNWNALSSLSNESRNDDTAELVLFVSTMVADGKPARHLHILGPIPRSQTQAASSKGLVQLYAAPIITPEAKISENAKYRLDVRSGTLTELAEGMLIVFDLTASIPKVGQSLDVDEATSFLRLSKTAVLTSAYDLLSVYNPQFQSLQSSISLDTDGQASGCSLVAYFSRLELAVGISDCNLIAIHLEAPKTRTKKRRAEGLLIDSIGRGVQQFKKTNVGSETDAARYSTFANYLPGSLRDDYWDNWTSGVQQADEWLEQGQIEALETFLAQKFGLQLKDKATINGAPDAGEKENQAQPLEWEWPASDSDFPRVDRRWVLYAISRAFQWVDEHTEGTGVSRIDCLLPYTNVVNYLVYAGHLTSSNVKSALRDQLENVVDEDAAVAEQLAICLAGFEPEMETLTAYISNTTLGAMELLLALRTIMRNLKCVQDPKEPPPKFLTNGTSEEADNEDVDNGDLEMVLDNLEQDVDKTLRDNMGARSLGISAAFEKLGNCPSTTTIKALRSTFKPEEILDMIHLLRVELVKGAWASRYLDNTEFEQDPNLEPPPDGVIKLLADLLGCCVDSIGPGGWLLNDTIVGDDSGDFVASLKLEVSAALEGINQAIYMRGIISQAVKYFEAAQLAEEQTSKVDVSKPIALNVRDAGSELLPLGLKTQEQIDTKKVVSGGEVIKRSAREMGHLRSQQVGAYSLERIAI